MPSARFLVDQAVAKAEHLRANQGLAVRSVVIETAWSGRRRLISVHDLRSHACLAAEVVPEEDFIAVRNAAAELLSEHFDSVATKNVGATQAAE